MYLACGAVSRRTAHARCTKWGSTGGGIGGMPHSAGSPVPLPVLPLLDALARAELRLGPVAVLAPVVVPCEEEGVGDLAPELAGDVDELDEPDDRGFGKDHPRPSYLRPRVRLDDLRLSVDHQPEGPLDGHHGQGFEGRVERQAAHRKAPTGVDWILSGRAYGIKRQRPAKPLDAPPGPPAR